MKLKMKLIAAAVVMAAAGQASAALTTTGTAGGGSLFLTVWDNVTKAYYTRDLGYTLNTFLPSAVTTAAGDGAATGDKSPEAGVTLNKVTDALFGGDSLFATTFASTAASDVRWNIVAADSVALAGTNNVSRFASTFTTTTPLIINSGVSNFSNNTLAQTNTVNALGITTSMSGAGINGVFAAGLSLANEVVSGFTSANFFYAARSTGTGSSSTNAVATQYGNSLNTATFSLASNGDLTYNLAPAVSAVPLPAAVWMLGSGLLGLLGVGRRKAV